MGKSKKIIIAFIIIVFIASLTIIIRAYQKTEITFQLSNSDFNVSYSSSHYTQVDDLKENPSFGSVLRLEVNETGNYDEHIISNEKYSLYFNRYLNIIKIKNKLTEYIWASGLDYIDNDDIQTSYNASLLSSTLAIGYYFYNTSNNSYTDPQYVFLNRANVDLTLESDVENKPMKIIPNTSDVIITPTIIQRGIKLEINLFCYQINLNAYFELGDDGLRVSIPNDEIKESKNLIASIYIMPAFGATKNNEEPGYMVIPDGCGALIRYGKTISTSQISMKYFGKDQGLGSSILNQMLNKEKNLSAPIFGLINGIKQDGVLGIIDSGCYNAELVISLCKTLNINYNFLTPRYLIRHQYLLYGVNKTVQKKRNGEDIIVNYQLLSNDDATYLGLAQTYQEYLVSKGELVKNTNALFRMNLEVLLSETVSALIGTKNINLTHLNDLNDMINYLNEKEVSNLNLTLKGWNKKGLSGNTPYQVKYNLDVGSTKAFKQLIFNNDSIYFYNDYQTAFDKGVASTRYDVARTIQRLKMGYHNDSLPLYQDYYKLIPEKSIEIAKNDISKYQKLMIPGLVLDSIGQEIFTSYYQGNISSRAHNASCYQELLEHLSVFNLGLFQPNSYLWQYIDSYFEMPLFSNQLSIYTDNIPLIPYILKNYVDYYGPSINFFANQTDQLLRLLDYGALPSYTITYVQSRELKYTNSNELFSTKFDDWKDTIVDCYHQFQEAFNLIQQAKITNREVLTTGVVRISYDNDIKIIINYTEKTYDQIHPNDFLIIKGDV